MKKETGKWKDRWKERDLLAEWRCSRAVLDFIATMDVGKRVAREEDDAVCAVSELEVREWQEEGGRGRGAGQGGTTTLAAGAVNPVDTGVHQGSAAAPILFVTYLSSIF